MADLTVSTPVDDFMGAATAAAMATAIGLGTSNTVTFSSLALTTPLAVNQGGTGSTTSAGAATNLGLGTTSNVTHASLSLTGSPLPVASGGTGAAAAGSTLLGNIGLTATGTNLAVATSVSNARSQLGLDTGDTPTFAGVDLDDNNLDGAGSLNLSTSAGGDHIIGQNSVNRQIHFRCHTSAHYRFYHGATLALYLDSSRITPGVAGGVSLGIQNTPFGSLYIQPGSSVTDPTVNGTITFEFTDNNTITVKGRGTDGTVRSGTINIA